MNKLKLALLEIARLKAKDLKCDTQIRLMADMDYVLFNIKDDLYVGYNINEPTDAFFPDKAEWILRDEKGEETARLQDFSVNLQTIYNEYFRNEKTN